MRILLLAMALSFGIPPAAPDLSGTWKVVIPAGSQKRPDGSKAEWKEMRGLLEIAQQGETLTATWRAQAEWKLTGRADADGRFALESGEQPVPMDRDGRKGSVPARWIMRGALKNGTLTGSAWLVVGDRDPVVHNWTASR